MFKSIRVGRGNRSSLLVVGLFKGQSSVPTGLTDLSDADRASFKAGLKLPGFNGEAGEVRVVGARHVLLGLGAKDELDAAALRTIGARLVRRIDGLAPKGLILALKTPLRRGLDGAEVGQALGEGMGLANFRVDFFDGASSKTPDAHGPLGVAVDQPDIRRGLERGLALAGSANRARRIAATPPNICHPQWLVTEARKMARETGLTCRVIDHRKATEMGMGGLLNVGVGSSHPPCLIILEHKPRKVAPGAKGETIALVGKTITFDTGGYSLKISGSMQGMKYDKNGGMAVLGAMHAIATLDLPVRVTAVLAVAENMISSTAYRVDDIITMYDGTTVEVTNTDAEGRLVLADALTYACRNVKATRVIDVATLTGGVVVALGEWCAGMWCDDKDLRGRLENAADATGERLWRLPLWDEHRDFMRSKHADLWNSGPKRDGHPIQGAAFLSHFVDEGVPWAHLDIAGVSTVAGDTDLFVTGPTGYGVRLLTAFVAGLA
ncbi:MAG: leucyl aminopeptidase family protein [Planctomycetota bacterium]|jgi:leucyl aminopeptidase